MGEVLAEEEVLAFQVHNEYRLLLVVTVIQPQVNRQEFVSLQLSCHRLLHSHLCQHFLRVLYHVGN